MGKFEIVKNMYMKHHKIRLYPSKEQDIFMQKCIDISRFLYNYGLDKALNLYELHQYDDSVKSSYSKYDFGIMLTELRKNPEYSFLLDIPHITERMALWNVQRSMDRYFRGLCRRPSFKSKKDLTTNKFKTRYDRCFFIGSGLKIEGLNTLIKSNFKTCFNNHKENPKMYNPVITKDKFGQYWFSFDYMEPIPKKPKDYGKLGRPLGIDLNIHKRFMMSDGSCIYGPDLYRDFFILRRYQRRMKKDILRREKMEKANPELAPIQKSNRSKKRQLKYAKQHVHISNKVETFIQMSTAEIIKMHPEAIVMENLNIHEIISDPVFASTIGHARPNFYRCREVMEYKCKLNHIPFILAPKTYPSTKRCSKCGYVSPGKIKGHRYKCKNCGAILNRDLNAAINLEQLAYLPNKELLEMGCRIS